MGMCVYNGKMYVGTLPSANVYRFDGDHNWSLSACVDDTPDVIYRRAWCMAVPTPEGTHMPFRPQVPPALGLFMTYSLAAVGIQWWPVRWHSAVRQSSLAADGRGGACSGQYICLSFRFHDLPLITGPILHNAFIVRSR